MPIRDYIDDLSCPDREIRITAVKGLAEMGEVAVVPLIRFLEESGSADSRFPAARRAQAGR